MHFYRSDSQPPRFSTSSNPPRRIRPALAAGLLALAALAGCSRYADQPEIDPRGWAPQTVDREWAPSRSRTALVGSAAEMALLSDQPPSAQRMDLTELIGFALDNNPSTRTAWKTAEAAAAAAGKARAPYYPAVTAESDNGYQRLVDLVPKHWGTLKTWQSRNIVSLDYDLIDFGRRDAASSAALNQLVEANLIFNRKVQEVVFNVERAFYELDAADAGVRAAEATLKLASTDRRAADLRQKHGLATAPEVLLARQRDAQAEFDLENARLAVSIAQADLAVALGVRADRAPAVKPLKDQPLPSTLSADVEQLIDGAVRERPDLAAKVSAVRARQADVELARASLYPTLGFTSFYGEQAFTYRLSNPETPTFTAMAPEYGAGVNLKWDIFTGFSRVNDIKEAEEQRDAARADLKSAELDVAANVWRAYFTYRTAQRKYEYAEALLSASQSSYNSNYKSYGLGLSTIIDLLSAERELAAARFTIIQTKAELLISAAAVTFATGAIPDQARP
ncbi:MAG TPA: TolC family protein [Candidatus Binataceae bacterium]|nr:TolC family protein [Candidatus Binataceae bacterium]